MAYRLSSLTAAEWKSYTNALVAPTRQVRCRARLFNKNEQPVGTYLEIQDGEVVIDTSDDDSPTRTAHLTLADPDDLLIVDTTATSTSKLWFHRLIEITWGIYVADLERWVDVPVFHGWIFGMSRTGPKLIDVDCQGKESGHLPNAVLANNYTIRKKVRIHRAIRKLMVDRGESSKFIDLNSAKRKTRRAKSYRLGASPWKIVQDLARQIDGHLFYRGDGVLRLRRVSSKPVWAFKQDQASIVLSTDESFNRESVFNMVVFRGTKKVQVTKSKTTRLSQKANNNDTHIDVVDAKGFTTGATVRIGSGKNASVRTVTSVATKRINFTKKALNRSYGKGTKVTVRWREKKEVPIIAREKLKSTHPLSAQTLSDNKRPLVKIINRSSLHKMKTVKRAAKKYLNHRKVGLEQEVSLTTLVVPHLEERDVIRVNVNGIDQNLRINRMTIPLSAGSMSINWSGKRVPKR